MKRSDVKIIAREDAFDGFFRIGRYHLRHALFEGGMSGDMDREVFERGHAVAAILYDPDLDRLVFTEQFRIGAYVAQDSRWFDEDASPWLIECMAGIIEDGETPEGVARRETVEETGCTITDILPVYHYMVSPGGTSESVFLFCGRVDATDAGGIYGITEEHENIRVLVASPEEAYDWLEQGRLNNAMAIIAVQWFRANRNIVRKAWLGDA